MSPHDRERELYDKYLDAVAEHAAASNALKALDMRHIQEGYDPAAAVVERIPLYQAKQDAFQRYQEARKAYEDYKQARVETDH